MYHDIPEVQEMLRLFQRDSESKLDPFNSDGDAVWYYQNIRNTHGSDFADEVWFTAYHMFKGDEVNV